MAAPAVCHLCDRWLPCGGVLDHVGRPCHYVCRELAQQQTAYHAQTTARRVAKGYPPRRSGPLLTPDPVSSPV